MRGLNVNTNTGTGISGASVGTLTINNASITNSNGSGVSLSNGALAVTFDSVTAINGANGIFISNTTGSFTVNGDGANTTLGGNVSGGEIKTTVGADGATAGSGCLSQQCAECHPEGACAFMITKTLAFAAPAWTASHSITQRLTELTETMGCFRKRVFISLS